MSDKNSNVKQLRHGTLEWLKDSQDFTCNKIKKTDVDSKVKQLLDEELIEKCEQSNGWRYGL